mmetsp:Transcript_3156/g.6796  ORF Transcript_3156/g.6796 Transcript_3156/m.6796 type:complete len:289 (+) Transcript_3156:334-1200(+)
MVALRRMSTPFPLCCPPPTRDTEPLAFAPHSRCRPQWPLNAAARSLGAVARRSVAGHCGFVHLVCLGQQLPKHQLVGIGGVELETPCRRNHCAPRAMQRWRHFQTTALVPAFRELRANNIYASVLKLACCQSRAHGHLSQHPSYLFFHAQDKDRCIETPATQPLELHLGFSALRAPPSRRARWPSSRSTAVSTGTATMASASASAPRCPRRSAGRQSARGFVRARSPSIGKRRRPTCTPPAASVASVTGRRSKSSYAMSERITLAWTARTQHVCVTILSLSSAGHSGP